jgi:hypothetical protein
MTTPPARITLVAPAMDEPILLSITTRTTETIRSARLLHGSLTFLLGSVELHELVQRQTVLELDPIHGHGDLVW